MEGRPPYVVFNRKFRRGSMVSQVLRELIACVNWITNSPLFRHYRQLLSEDTSALQTLLNQRSCHLIAEYSHLWCGTKITCIVIIHNNLEQGQQDECNYSPYSITQGGLFMLEIICGKFSILVYLCCLQFSLPVLLFLLQSYFRFSSAIFSPFLILSKTISTAFTLVAQKIF